MVLDPVDKLLSLSGHHRSGRVPPVVMGIEVAKEEAGGWDGVRKQCSLQGASASTQLVFLIVEIEQSEGEVPVVDSDSEDVRVGRRKVGNGIDLGLERAGDI